MALYGMTVADPPARPIAWARHEVLGVPPGESGA